MTRDEILDKAKACVMEDRSKTYGPPENSFAKVARLWSAYLGLEEGVIRPHDAAAMLALLKIARVSYNPGHADNWVDMAGYASCGGELAMEGKKA